MQNTKYFDKFNIMIIGDEKVGKTSILERYFNKQFTMDRKQTLGVELYEKEKIIGNQKILFKIWDTAGQEKFAIMAKSYYQRAHGIIAACAVNNKNSFINLRNWLNAIKENCAEDSIQLIIIANKCDLVKEREVGTEDIITKAKDLNVEYFETSAKDNIAIDEAFEKIIDKVYQNAYNRPKGFNLEDEGQGGGRKCC